MTEDKQGSGFSWFVAGLGLGALLGVLYAPKAGREVREDVANSARDGAEYLKQRSRETADQVAVLVEKGKAQVNDYVGQGKEYIERGRAQVEQAVDTGPRICATAGGQGGCGRGRGQTGLPDEHRG